MGPIPAAADGDRMCAAGNGRRCAVKQLTGSAAAAEITAAAATSNEQEFNSSHGLSGPRSIGMQSRVNAGNGER